MTASYQPQRRGRPVVVPNSAPTSRSRSPHSSSSSVGNGPDPTRVVYALTTPTTAEMRIGGMPEPVQAPPAVGFDDVTNGYVPWSTSSSVAWPPSSNTVQPSSSALDNNNVVSATYGRSRSAYARSSSATWSTLIARRLNTFTSTWFLCDNAPSSFCRRIFSSNRSCTRMPTRATLSAYAGPMPRPVVPIFALPRKRSVTRSSVV